MALFSAAWLSCPAMQEVDPWLCVPAFRRVCLFGVRFYCSRRAAALPFHFSKITLQVCNGQPVHLDRVNTPPGIDAGPSLYDYDVWR